MAIVAGFRHQVAPYAILSPQKSGALEAGQEECGEYAGTLGHANLLFGLDAEYSR
jgi:hypothetical protein